MPIHRYARTTVADLRVASRSSAEKSFPRVDHGVSERHGERDAMGQFGGVPIIGGNLSDVVHVASVQIYDHVEGDALEYAGVHRPPAV